MKTNRILLFLLPLLMAGCTDNVVFQADTEVPSGIWERNWKPTFSFEIADTNSQGDIYLEIRHNGDYPFSNI